MGQLNQLAPGVNAFTFRFDGGALQEARDLFRQVVSKQVDVGWLETAATRSGTFDHGDCGFHFTTNGLGSDPVMWVSPGNLSAHTIFRRFFDSLEVTDQVKQLVDHERTVVVYCGFFIIGTRARGEAWHVDYEWGANAYTLLTPLLPPEPSHGDLLYYDQNSEVRTYEYRSGEAILFGDNFYHSAERYQSAGPPRVLLSVTVGTDRMKYWPKLAKTVGSQTDFLVLPCGDPKGSCDHLPA